MDKTRTTRIKAVALAAGLCIVVAFWAGCSEERNYQTLSFFFDGVPDPHAVATTQGIVREDGSTTGGPPRPAGTVMSVHKPYADQKCTECHAGTSITVSAVQDPNLCSKCHEKVFQGHTAMHGPVIGKACLWCHEPHESASKSLLKTTAPSLCLQCHERELLSTKEPAHTSPTTSCLDCHNGHGGEKIPFLRASYTTTRPVKTPG